MDSFNSSRFLDDSTRQKLNRSMSLSELSPRKKITVQQKLLSGPSGDTVYRQCSYEELRVIPGTSSLRFSQKFVSELHVNLSESNFVPTFEMPKTIENHTFDKFFTPPEKISKIKTCSEEIEQYRKRPHEPSGTFTDFKRKKLFKVSPASSHSNSNKTVHSNLTSGSHIDNDQHTTSTKRWLWIILPVLLVVFATVGTQIVASYQKMCDSKLDINALEHLLRSRIFGQEKAVRNTVETFKKFYSSEYGNIQVLVFTGATGVGKTYAASLLEEVFPWKHNVHHFIMPINFEDLTQHAVQKFPHCGDHLVIMEDLREDDIQHIGYIALYLKKLAERNKVTAVLIFKFHKQLAGKISEAEVVQKSNEVQTNLTQRGIYCEIVSFKALEKQDVIQCIEEALKRHWIPVSVQSVNTILNQVDYHSEGCKRINSKIAIVNELWVRHL